MEITNDQFRAFVNDRLKLPGSKREEHLEQVGNLITRFKQVADEQAPELGVQRFLRTGSMWKGTVMRAGADADVAVFIEVEQTSDVIDVLHARIKKLLKTVYPQKADGDFAIQPRTLGIHFIDSGLDVDLVPVIPISGPGDYGLQPSSGNGAMTLTSVSGQLDFIRKHKDAYYNWTALVRLLKRWRTNKELEMSSFAIELIVCYLQDNQGKPGSIGDGLSRFWRFLAADARTEIIAFTSAQGGKGAGKHEDSPIVLIDPVNADNNILRKMSESEADEISDVAEESWSLHHEARTATTKGATLDNMRSILGTDFDYE